jgi:hypothetical protein
LQEPIDYRIYFWGEHLADDDYDLATVHGAAISGRNVVQQMIKNFAKRIR